MTTPKDARKRVSNMHLLPSATDERQVAEVLKLLSVRK